MRITRILIVFEFPPGEHEWQLRDLAAGLRANDANRDIRFCGGFIERYRPGGLAPGRVMNSMWVHLRAFCSIVFGRSDEVIVHTAPPLIQMTVALACRLRSVRYGVWLMDAHPELEAAIWGRVPGLGSLVRMLVRMNSWCLLNAGYVVVLDPAMRQRLVPTLPAERVIVCPTWGANRLQGARLLSQSQEALGPLRFVYLGNLGLAHDVSLLCRFLSVCAERGGVELRFVGTSAKSVDLVARELAGCRVRCESVPGIPFAQLAEEIPPWGFDFGIVALKGELSGLLSPSKFTGYLVAGLPLIYLGPPGTNSADVCDRFEAGVRLDATSLASDSDGVVRRLQDGVLRRKLRENIAAALAYFGGFDGDFLADQIDARLRAR